MASIGALHKTQTLFAASPLESNVAARAVLNVAGRAALAVPGRVAGTDAAASRAEVPTRPNNFGHELQGRTPPTSTGSFLSQLREGWMTAGLALEAHRSVQSGGQSPSDAEVRQRLTKLDYLPLIDDPAKVTVAKYQSTVPGASGANLYKSFVADPGTFLDGGNLAARPAPRGGLKNGMRLMMEDQSTPNLWLPVEVRLDPKAQKVTFLTLSGHALRGFNEFQFKSEGGGAKIVQTSRFQGSSPLTTLGTTLADATEHQHDVWKGVHNRFYDKMGPFEEQVA